MDVAVVTGASGFIGSRLRERLMAAGWDVVAFRRPASPPARVGRSVEVDYGDPGALRRTLDEIQPAWVFHVAGATKGVTESDFRRANVVPTEALVAGLARSPRLQRFIHVSTLAAFGPSTTERPHTEDAKAAPVEHYGRSKLEAERVVESSSLPYTVLRPGGVYGPGDVDYFKLFQLAAQGWNIFFGNRQRSFSKIYVDDLVSAILLAAEHPAAQRRSYFLCDGQPLTFEAFQAEIARQAGRRVRELDLPEFLTWLAAVGGELLTRIDRRPRLFNRQKAEMGRRQAWTCSPAAFFQDTGFVPEFDVTRGVTEAYAWYRAQGWLPTPASALTASVPAPEGPHQKGPKTP